MARISALSSTWDVTQIEMTPPLRLTSACMSIEYHSFDVRTYMYPRIKPRPNA